MSHGGGGMGHHSGGGNHSGFTHGGAQGHSGLTLGHILGLNHTQHHQHGMHGGMPDQSPSWNMAMQAEKPTLVRRLLNANVGPAILLGLLMCSMIFWLWLIDILHQHEMDKNRRQQSYAADQFHSLSLNRGAVPQDVAPAAVPQFGSQQASSEFGVPQGPTGDSTPPPSYPPAGSQPQASPAFATQYGASQYSAAAPVTAGYPGAASPAATAPTFGDAGRMSPSAYNMPINTPGGPRMRVTVNR